MVGELRNSHLCLHRTKYLDGNFQRMWYDKLIIFAQGGGGIVGGCDYHRDYCLSIYGTICIVHFRGFEGVGEDFQQRKLEAQLVLNNSPLVCMQ